MDYPTNRRKSHLLVRDLRHDIEGFFNTFVRNLDALLEFCIICIPVETQNVK
jgi:hypothetical protein